MTRQMTREILDERLDSLLDEALALPEAPPGLTDRVLAATEPARAGRGRAARSADGGVLARIGPGLLALAATLGLASVAAVWVASVATPAPRTEPGSRSVADAGAAPLMVDAPWDASIDEAITLLALQVEMVDLRWDDTWAEPGEGVEDSVLRWELEAMRDDGMVF